MTKYIPLWTKNINILSGYRNKQKNKLCCLFSVFKIHN